MKYLLLISTTLISSVCFAQRQAVYFMKNSGQYVSIKDSADFIRVVNQPDAGSKLYKVFDFYNDGKGKMEATSTAMDPVKLEGPCRTYYRNGNRQKVATYKNNTITGDVFEYFPNGKLYYIKNYRPDSIAANKERIPQPTLITACNDSTGKALVADGNGHFIGYDNKFTKVILEGDVKAGKMTGEWNGYEENLKLKVNDLYTDGHLIKGTSTDSTGKSVDYTKQFIEPQYKGGITAFYKFLGSHIRYPANDRVDHIQGAVILKFVVGKYGNLLDIKVFRSVSPACDAEAIRVIKLSEDAWQPGYDYGRPADHFFTIPINFTLGNQ